jgi:DNA-binding response OmpR family regulator
MEQASRPVVAVINTSAEILELLQEFLSDEGYDVVPAYTVDFKRGERDFHTFVAEYRPQAVLWDISIPYMENWAYFRDTILGSGVLPERCFVCSTVNRTVLEMLVGPTSTIELIGRPFDLDVIGKRIRRIVEGSSSDS